MDYLYLYCQEFCRKSLDKVAFIEEHYLERAILIRISSPKIRKI